VCCFTVVGVLFSLWCSKRTRTVIIFTCYCYVIRSMASHHFPIHVHSNKLWFYVNNEITLISAKFSVTLSDQHTSCKTAARCLALYDALTTTQASIASLTSFFYDVILHCRPLHVRNGLSFAYLWRVLGEFEPLNVVGHRADPKKELPCMIARNLSHCAWKSDQGSLQ